MSQQQYEQEVAQWEQFLSSDETRQAMKIDDMIESKYIKQSDVTEETLVTIRAIKKVNVARDDETPEYRWTVTFAEFPKPMVLNVTNIKRVAKALGDDTDGWIGGQVVVYVDPDIEFGGNIVGGLRIRAARSKVKTPQPDTDKINRDLARAGADNFDNDVPF